MHFVFPVLVKRSSDIALRFMVKADTYEEDFCCGVVIHWEAIIVSVALKKMLMGLLECADTAWVERKKLEER